MGVSTKETREAILNANPSLKANPDKIIVGRTYVIPPTGGTATSSGSPAPVAVSADTRCRARGRREAGRSRPVPARVGRSKSRPPRN